MKKQDFITKANKTHNNFYDYSLVPETVVSKDKVTIICPEHGEFIARVDMHIHKTGCKKCGENKLSVNQRLTTEEFIKRAKLKHGNIYDYSQTVYINSLEKVKIRCIQHDTIFKQIAGNHINGKSGCPVCNEIKSKRCNNVDLLNTITKAKEIHGDKYDYSLINTETYKNYHSRIKIICKEHGVFETTFGNHISHKTECPRCGINSKISKTLISPENFIKHAKEIHGDKYDYSLIDEAINSRCYVDIICPIHGEFNQLVSTHLGGCGCTKCGKITSFEKKSLKDVDFLIRANNIHNNKYKYIDLPTYCTSYDKIKIECQQHGVFEQIVASHLAGSGCIECGRISTIEKQSLNINDFIKRALIVHNNKYDYSKVYDDLKSYEKITIICPIHGEFEQIAENHLQGKGCRKCSSHISRQEQEIFDFISTLTTHTIEQGNRSVIPPLELDIYIPALSLAIEFNGLYWHSEEYKHKNYHIQKTEICESKSIHLIQIYEDDWLYKQDIVKSRLQNIFKKNETRIQARKCVIKTVDSKEEREFLEKNHIQGYVASKICFGLYYENQLQSLMSFGGNKRINKQMSEQGKYELLRFCNKINTTVIGGAGKLFSKFLKLYKPINIISFADRCWTKQENNVYETLGFKLTHVTEPNYSYIVDNERQSRFRFQKHILVEKYGCSEDDSERNFCFNQGWYRIYNSGNLVYEYNK